MQYDQVAHFASIGGTIFFFVFFAVMIVAVFWRKNANTVFGAAWPALAVFAVITASFFLAAKFGSMVLLLVTLLMIIGFVFSLRFFKSVDDERYSGIASLPLSDGKPIIDEVGQ